MYDEILTKSQSVIERQEATIAELVQACKAAIANSPHANSCYKSRIRMKGDSFPYECNCHLALCSAAIARAEKGSAS